MKSKYKNREWVAVSSRKFYLLRPVGIVAASMAFVLGACGGGGDDDEETVEETTSTAAPTASGGGSTTTTSSKKLTDLYPVDLGLSLFPTATGSSLYLQSETATDGASAGESLTKKKADAEKKLSGQGDCLGANLAKKPPSEGAETCYEFDQDMVYGTKDGTKYFGTKNGYNGKGEACLPAFARSKVDQMADMVDRATGMIQAMFCQAKKSDANLALPEKGKSVDLLAALKTAFGNKATKISSAKMSREAADDSAGNPIYVSEIEIVDINNATRIVSLVHSPRTNGDYIGTLINAVVQVADAAQPWVDANKVHYVTVAYSKTTGTDGVPVLDYEARSARIHSDIENVFDAEGQLDYNANADFTVATTDGNYGMYKKADGTYFAQSNDAISGIVYVLAQVKPSDNTGTFLYAQNPGGNFSEPARGVVASLALDGSGVLGGCALSGAMFTQQGQGISVRKSIKSDLSLDPTGFYHPFFNSVPALPASTGSDSDGSYYQRTMTMGATSATSKWYLPTTVTTADATAFVTNQTGNYITRQCFDLIGGKYVIDTADIPDTAGYQLLKTDTTVGNTIKPPKSVDGAKPPKTPTTK